MTEPKKRAAPVVRTDAIIDLIIESVSEGTPLAEVCRQDWAPHPATVYAWLNDDPVLERRFAHARELGQAAIEAHSRLVAAGTQGYSSGDVKRDRLIVDVANRMIDRWDRRYAEREAAGEAKGPLVDPRTGFYFSLEEQTEFCVFVILARAQRRRMAAEEIEGVGSLERWLQESGYPDLETCEAIVSGRDEHSRARLKRLPAPLNDASDLA